MSNFLAKFYIFSILILTFICKEEKPTHILGIDFGSSLYKVSLITQQQQLDIVETIASQRKIETVVSFTNQQKQYETNSLNKKSRFPENTFTFTKKFLAALQNDQQLLEISKQQYDSYKLSFDPDFQSYQFQLNDKYYQFEEQSIFTKIKTTLSNSNEIINLKVEEIIGLQLKYAKFLAERQSKDTINNCIITIPSNWNISQRNRLLSSAKIAGLNVLQLIHENTAAAITFSTRELDDYPYLTLFYNMGAYYTQVSVIQFSQRATSSISQQNVVKVLSDSTIENLGGSAFDQVLANHFAEEIDQIRNNGESVKNDNQIMIKLLRECKKVKEVLSANKEARINIEQLYDKQDFHSSIQRSVFEQKSQHLFDQITKPVEDALKKARKKINHIKQVELIGGGIRIPKIKDILKDFFEDEFKIGAHINGDESMTFGATMYGNNILKIQKAKDIELIDGFSNRFNIEIKNLNGIYKKGDENYVHYEKDYKFKTAIGTKEIVQLQTLSDLQIEITQEDYQGNVSHFATYNTTNIESNYNETVQKIPNLEFIFEIDSVKGLHIKQSTVKYYYTEETKVAKETKENEKEFTRINDEDKYVYKLKKKLHNDTIEYKTHFSHMQELSESQIKQSQELIQRFEQQESKHKSYGEIRNKFEQLVYEALDKSEDGTYETFAQKEEIISIKQKAKQYEQEIIQENYNPTEDQLNKKYNDLYKLVGPVKTRIHEKAIRHQKVKEFEDFLKDYKEKVNKFTTSKPWIQSNEKKKIRNMLSKSKSEITKMLEQQEKLADNQDPVFFTKDLIEIQNAIDEEYQRLKAIKKTVKKNDL